MLDWLSSIDREVLLLVNGMHHPWADQLMWFLSMSWPTYLLVVLFAWSFQRKRRNTKKTVEFLLGCAMVVACTDVTTNIVKHNVKRFRPTHDSELNQSVRVYNNYQGGKYGFFSAHASNTFAVVTYLYLCLKYLDRRWRILLFIYPVLVMYSRVYLGVHFPSDVLTGMFCGLLFGWLGYLLVNSYFLRRDEGSTR